MNHSVALQRHFDAGGVYFVAGSMDVNILNLSGF